MQNGSSAPSLKPGRLGALTSTGPRHRHGSVPEGTDEPLVPVGTGLHYSAHESQQPAPTTPKEAFCTAWEPPSQQGAPHREGVMWGGVDVQTYNLFVLSASFLAMFSAYNTLQNFITSLLSENHLGATVMFLNYIVVVFALFVAPPLINRAGPRLCMVLSFAVYTMFMVSLLHVVEQVVLACACLVGVATAVMWVAHGVYLTNISSESRRGENCGIFFATFQSSHILGNIGAFLVTKYSTTLWLYVMFVVLATVGTVGLLLLVPYEPQDVPPCINNVLIELSDQLTTQNQQEIQRASYTDLMAQEARTNPPSLPATTSGEGSMGGGAQAVTVFQLISSSVRVLRYPRLSAMLPLFFFMGLQVSFWTGEFTQMLAETSIGLVITMAGVGEITGALGIGWLSDRVGKSPTAIYGMVCFLGALGLTGAIQTGVGLFCDVQWVGAPWAAYVCSFLFGHADGVSNTIVYALLGSVYPDESTPVFTVLQVFYFGGTAFGYFIFPACPVHGPTGSMVLVWVMVALTVVGFSGFVAADTLTRARRAGGSVDHLGRWAGPSPGGPVE